ncbi:MAG TPA: uracil-DNA glycosylase family protein [Dongiaceae bacterium]|nr:uracil-DNA glycosylase family protein [Dongiaceae bacterium]
MAETEALAQLLGEVAACRLCAAHLPFAPRPVLRLASSARLLIVGQAPGTRVHKTGVPFDDPSGERLRDWLALDRAAFYDEARVAIVPMGFCYPGTAPGGGDLPPRPECAPLWHGRLRAALPEIELTLLVGRYAQVFYLGRAHTMTDTVRAWRDAPPGFWPLPHPSWRNTAWLKRNPWFAAELLPALRARLRSVLADGDGRSDRRRP